MVSKLRARYPMSDVNILMMFFSGHFLRLAEPKYIIYNVIEKLYLTNQRQRGFDPSKAEQIIIFDKI